MRIVILGTGNMAASHAAHFSRIKGVEIAAAVDLDQSRVDAFAHDYDIPRTFTSLEAALDWGEFDAVANVTPDQFHYTTTMQALHAGKHIFCEKPLATDHAQAQEMTRLAGTKGLVAMVNLTYRNVAELQKLRDIVTSGAIGEVRHVEASYLQSWLVSKTWGDWRTEGKWLWRLSRDHGSNGTLGDIGIHILDFAVYGAGVDVDTAFCRLHTFHKAEGDRIGDYVLDANDSFTMSLQFQNGALGVVHASRWASGYLNTLRLRIYGDKGGVEVQHGHDASSLRMCEGADLETQTWREVPVEPIPTNYHRFAHAVAAGETEEPSFRHATQLQRVLDLGFVSDRERREVAI